MGITKSRLAILLSWLEVFEDPSLMDEQYPTDPEIAAQMLWTAHMLGDITGRKVIDLGCGTGILTLGAALLDANVIGIDNDAKALNIARSNKRYLEEQIEGNLRVTFSKGSVDNVKLRADTVIQNPPFGTKKRHADRNFLAKACTVAPVVWTFHKASTARFVERFSMDAGYEITHRLDFDLPIKASMAHHTRRIAIVKVGCWRLVRST